MIDCNSLPSANGRERRVVEVGKRHSELMERVDKEFLRENTSYLDTSERNCGAVLGDRERACREDIVQDRSVLQDLDGLSTGVGDGRGELELVEGGDTRGGTR